MRRMKEMSQTGGGGMFGWGISQMYNLVVNTNSELATNILNTADKNAQESLVKQALDLANCRRTCSKAKN
jgi:molecular chaperone HtpG